MRIRRVQRVLINAGIDNDHRDVRIIGLFNGGHQLGGTVWGQDNGVHLLGDEVFHDLHLLFTIAFQFRRLHDGLIAESLRGFLNPLLHGDIKRVGKRLKNHAQTDVAARGSVPAGAAARGTAAVSGSTAAGEHPQGHRRSGQRCKQSLLEHVSASFGSLFEYFRISYRYFDLLLLKLFNHIFLSQSISIIYPIFFVNFCIFLLYFFEIFECIIEIYSKLGLRPFANIFILQKHLHSPAFLGKRGTNAFPIW